MNKSSLNLDFFKTTTIPLGSSIDSCVGGLWASPETDEF